MTASSWGRQATGPEASLLPVGHLRWDLPGVPETQAASGHSGGRAVFPGRHTRPGPRAPSLGWGVIRRASGRLLWIRTAGLLLVCLCPHPPSWPSASSLAGQLPTLKSWEQSQREADSLAQVTSGPRPTRQPAVELTGRPDALCACHRLSVPSQVEGSGDEGVGGRGRGGVPVMPTPGRAGAVATRRAGRARRGSGGANLVGRPTRAVPP